MAVSFQVERLSGRLAGEIEGLSEAHGDEFTYWKELKGPVDIDWAYYFSRQASGNLAIVTARDIHRLVGYFVYEFGGSPHYRTVSQVKEDTFYLLPEYRKGITGYKFLAFANRQMEQAPATIIKVVSKVKADYAILWERLGFTAEEVHYTRVNPRLEK